MLADDECQFTPLFISFIHSALPPNFSIESIELYNDSISSFSFTKSIKQMLPNSIFRADSNTRSKPLVTAKKFLAFGERLLIHKLKAKSNLYKNRNFKLTHGTF